MGPPREVWRPKRPPVERQGSSSLAKLPPEKSPRRDDDDAKLDDL